jgi:SARP family transcriptional regulator, regulator of embCAB operon
MGGFLAHVARIDTARVARDRHLISSAESFGLRYRLLGPLEVARDGRCCTPSAPKQRILLALLLLHANELLSVERIIDELWEHRPPRSVHAALQMYVSALRRALQPGHRAAGRSPRSHPVLRTEASGYILRAGADELDLAQFRALAARGRARLAAGDCESAGEHFRQALSLWRGPALAGLSRSGELSHYAVRLNEERLSLIQERVAVDICQGRSLEIVGELEELCARYPLHEPFHEQLMLALAHSGRRADALGVYSRVYQIMIENVGIGPGSELRAAQQTILDGWEPRDGRHECTVQRPARCHADARSRQLNPRRK